METILQVIENQGGLKRLEEEGHFKIENKPYMALSIDFIGRGPNGYPMIAVAHNFIQNGDVMADPDMQLEIANNILYPVTYQLDSMGIFQEVYRVNANGQNIGINPVAKRELSVFLRQWQKNLKDQGFIEASQKQAVS